MGKSPVAFFSELPDVGSIKRRASMYIETNGQKPEFKIEDIMSVYSGKEGKCCCGCNGKHYHDDMKQKTRIVNILNKAKLEDLDIHPVYAATVVGNRLYIAYFNK
jgi:hypothetical protein